MFSMTVLSWMGSGYFLTIGAACVMIVVYVCVTLCGVSPQCRNCDYSQEADNSCVYVNKITHEVE